MGAWNFKKQFAPKVESGEKRQTIRAKRKDGRDPKVGDRQALYTGMRTSLCRKLGDGIIRLRAPITIDNAGLVLPSVLHASTTFDEIARADGFDSYPDMLGWFKNNHGPSFDGFLYRWDLIKDSD